MKKKVSGRPQVFLSNVPVFSRHRVSIVKEKFVYEFGKYDKEYKGNTS